MIPYKLSPNFNSSINMVEANLWVKDKVEFPDTKRKRRERERDSEQAVE